MSHERIEQLEIGKHVRLRSGDGRVKVDVHCSDDTVGVWANSDGGPQIGIVAESRKPPYFMIYTKLSATVPVALSASGIQVPSPHGGNPKILSWAQVYELVKNL